MMRKTKINLISKKRWDDRLARIYMRDSEKCAVSLHCFLAVNIGVQTVNLLETDSKVSG